MEYLLLLLFLRAVTAIKLPGSACPKVPNTHRQSCLPSDLQKILCSIPYTMDKPTHLFREMNNSAIELNRYLASFSPDFQAAYALTLTDRLNFKFYISSEVVSFNNKSFGLKSDVFSPKFELENVPMCPTPIVEDVHIWCEDPFLFIWSCTAGLAGKDHEEALLIIEKLMKIGSTQEEVLRVARRFLPQDLLARINIKQPIKQQNGPAGGFFTCTQPSLKWAPYVLVSIVLLLVVVVAICCYLTKKEEGE